MKMKLHLATREFCYIEVEVEGTLLDAVKAHRELNRLIHLEGDEFRKEVSGLTTKDYAEVRRKLLNTGEFDVNLEEEMSYQQLRWVKDTNNTLREARGEANEEENNDKI